MTPTNDAGEPTGEAAYTISAPHVAITLGGTPVVPSEEDVPGASLGITSDGFFGRLEHQPKRMLTVGAGYIACELSQVMNACVLLTLPTRRHADARRPPHSLGTETHVAIRGDKVLRTFDPLIQDTIVCGLGLLLYRRSRTR